MDGPKIIVGTAECQIKTIASVITSNLAMRESWSTFAVQLGIPSHSIKKFKEDMRLEKLTYSDVIQSVLEEWVGQEGSSAKLNVLLEALRFVGAGGVAGELLKRVTQSDISGNIKEKEIIIGDCGLEVISGIFRRDLNLQKKWSTFATELGISSQRIMTFRSDLLIDKINMGDILCEVLELWRAAKGDKATLAKLLVVIEEGCDCIDVGDKLRISFNLCCKGANFSTKWDDLSLEFREKVEGFLKSFWPNINFDKFERSLIKGEHLVDLMIGRKPNLLKCRLQPKPNYYIKRKLFSRNIISKEIFQAELNDIFVFTGMHENELSLFAGNQDKSTTRDYLTSSCSTMPRFMLLDESSPTDFEDICNKTNKDVHLIQYESFGEIFTWKKSNGEIGNLHRFIYKDQRELEEEDFIKLDSSTPFCLSDSPGMGKSVLLEQIGRELKKSGIEVILLECTGLVKEVKRSCRIDLQNIKQALLNLSCDNELAQVIIKSKLSLESREIELLLDALDEVDTSDYLETLKILKLIRKELKSVRLWVTTRPHHLEELERCLQVFGYKIKPFNTQDQIQFLTLFWKQSLPAIDENVGQSLQIYATEVISTLNTNLNLTLADEDICGLPLQCLLIAEVYEISSLTFATNLNSLKKPRINSITDLFLYILVKKFKKFIKVHLPPDWTAKDINILLRKHIRFSLEILFPEQANMDTLIQVEYQPEELVKVGIVEMNSGKPKFIHRTFAEYLVALWIAEDSALESELTRFVVEQVMEVEPFRVPILGHFIISSKFVRQPICYFLNNLIDSSLLEKSNLFQQLYKSNPSLLQNIAHSCANSNFLQVLKLFFGANGKEVFPILNSDILQVAVKTSSADFVKFIFPHVEKFVDYSLLIKSFRLSIQRGAFFIFDFLFNLPKWDLQKVVKEMESLEIKRILHDCIKETKYLLSEQLKDKKEILNRLAKFNALLLAQKDELGRPLILSPYADISLILELLRLKVNLSAKDKFGNGILHLSINNCRRFSKEDFNTLFKAIPKEKLKGLLQMKGEYGDTPLLRLVRILDPLPETLQNFAAFSDFNSKDNQSYLVLAIAVEQKRSLFVLEKLIELGGNELLKWRRREDGATLLHLAAEIGNVVAIQMLINHYNFEVNIEDGNGNTPLDFCVISEVEKNSGSRLVAGKVLHNLGGILSETNSLNKSKLIESALEKGNIDSFQLLKYLENKSGFTAPQLTQQKHELLDDHSFGETVREFVQMRGCTCYTENGNSLLHIAIERGDEQAVKDIVISGGDVNVKNSEMKSPLQICFRNDIEFGLKIINFLFDNKANPYVRCGENETFLYYFITNNISPTPDQFHKLGEILKTKGLLKLLNLEGGRINASPFHRAAFYLEIKEETLKMFAENQVNFNLLDRYTRTPLTDALAGERSILLVSNLIKFGADPNYLDKSLNNFLHVSAKYGHLEAVEYFLNEPFKFDVNSVNKLGRTPLHLMLSYGNKKMVEITKLLIRRGSNLQQKDLQGLIPLDIAYGVTEANGRSKLTEIIKSAMNSNNFNPDLNQIRDRVDEEQLSLHKAVNSISNANDCINVIKSLIDDEVNVFGTDENRATFIHAIFNKGNWFSTNHFHQLSEFLINRGHSKVFEIVGGTIKCTPLQIAVLRLELEEQTLLDLYSDDVDFNALDGDGDNIFTYAFSGRRSVKFLEDLLRFGVDINYITTKGNGAIHKCANYGRADQMEFLLGLGKLYVNQKNSDGDSPLHYVLRFGKRNVMEMVKVELEIIKSGHATLRFHA